MREHYDGKIRLLPKIIQEDFGEHEISSLLNSSSPEGVLVRTINDSLQEFFTPRLELFAGFAKKIKVQAELISCPGLLEDYSNKDVLPQNIKSFGLLLGERKLALWFNLIPDNILLLGLRGGATHVVDSIKISNRELKIKAHEEITNRISSRCLVTKREELTVIVDKEEGISINRERTLIPNKEL